MSHGFLDPGVGNAEYKKRENAHMDTERVEARSSCVAEQSVVPGNIGFAAELRLCDSGEHTRETCARIHRFVLWRGQQGEPGINLPAVINLPIAMEMRTHCCLP